MFDPHRRPFVDLATAQAGAAKPLNATAARPALGVVPKTILQASEMGVKDVIAAITEQGYSHVVQSAGLAYDQEYAAAERMIDSPEEYFQNPVHTVFGEGQFSGLTSFQLTLEANEKKHRLLDSFTELLSTVKGSKRILVQALSMADELYTNASKVSWDPGDRLYLDPPRRHGQIDFIAAADGTRLLLCCRDTFGRLSIARLLERLKLCSQNGIANSISTNSPGAGIGAFLTFDSSVSFYAGVIPGECTLVCATLPLGMSGAVYADLPKNLHLVVG